MKHPSTLRPGHPRFAAYSRKGFLCGVCELILTRDIVRDSFVMVHLNLALELVDHGSIPPQAGKSIAHEQVINFNQFTRWTAYSSGCGVKKRLTLLQ